VKHSHQALIEFLEGVDAESFGRDFGPRRGRYQVTIAGLLEGEAVDGMVHCRQGITFRARAGLRRGIQPSPGAVDPVTVAGAGVLTLAGTVPYRTQART
jgi:hypothetical protein